MSEILNPFELYFGQDGRPISAGSLYIGVAGLDPQIHPIDVFYDREMTVPAQQPLNISGGYVWNCCAPTKVFAEPADYSLKVLGKNGEQVFYCQTVELLDDASRISYLAPFTGAVTRTQADKNTDVVSIKDFGAIGDGGIHPLSERFTTLAAAQAAYPHVTSLDETIDWAAAQAAANAVEEFGRIEIVGCLRINKTIVLKTGQTLAGKNASWFVNTNNGTSFAGALSGTIPEYGIFYDADTGYAIDAPEAVTLTGFNLFGRGYTTQGVNILKPSPSTTTQAVGIKMQKFCHLKDMSIYYFDRAYHSTGGNYYSRYINVEFTRLRCIASYDLATFGQNFVSCTARNVDTLFEFSGYARNFVWLGGSIEGYNNATNTCLLIPAFSDIKFKGTYFETMRNDVITKSVLKFGGGHINLTLDDCTIYLNHCEKFLEQNGRPSCVVKSSGNTLLVSTDSTVTNPIMYSVSSVDADLSFDAKNDHVINYDAAATTTGSVTAGSNSLTVAVANKFNVGQRVDITGADTAGGTLITTITAVSGTTITLNNAATTTVSNATVEVYCTVQYVPYSTGTALSKYVMRYPAGTTPRFDNLDFAGSKGRLFESSTTAPKNPFAGGNAAVPIYFADYATWNPASKADNRGAYPVCFRGGKYIPMLGGFAGSFTMSAAATFTVSNTNVSANSKIILMPTNAAAATLQKNKPLYISAKSNATSFSVATADATVAAGTETFDYFIYD